MGKLQPPPQIVRELIARGLPPAPLLEQTTALTRYFHRLLVLRTAAANDELVRVLHAIADLSLARARPDRAFACRKGCASCCSNHVSILAPEAFALARRLRGVRHAATHDRLRAHVAIQGSMALRERRIAGVFCGVLTEGACAAYAARPLVCRMFNSFDLAACLTSAAGGPSAIPQWTDHATLRSTLGVILFAAMAAAGLTPGGHELNRTVAALVDDPGLEARWYAGEDPFETHANDMLSPDVRVSIAAFAASAGLALPRRVDSH